MHGMNERGAAGGYDAAGAANHYYNMQQQHHHHQQQQQQHHQFMMQQGLRQASHPSQQQHHALQAQQFAMRLGPPFGTGPRLLMPTGAPHQQQQQQHLPPHLQQMMMGSAIPMKTLHEGTLQPQQQHTSQQQQQSAPPSQQQQASAQAPNPAAEEDSKSMTYLDASAEIIPLLRGRAARERSSLQVFRKFLSYRKNPATGALEVDASRITSVECYNAWLATRKYPPAQPQKAFQRALASHVTAADERCPFIEDEEAAILQLIRTRVRWPCFPEMVEGSWGGAHGYRGRGYHENQRAMQRLALENAASAAAASAASGKNGGEGSSKVSSERSRSGSSLDSGPASKRVNLASSSSSLSSMDHSGSRMSTASMESSSPGGSSGSDPSGQARSANPTPPLYVGAPQSPMCNFPIVPPVQLVRETRGSIEVAIPPPWITAAATQNQLNVATATTTAPPPSTSPSASDPQISATIQSLESTASGKPEAEMEPRLRDEIDQACKAVLSIVDRMDSRDTLGYSTVSSLLRLLYVSNFRKYVPPSKEEGQSHVDVAAKLFPNEVIVAFDIMSRDQAGYVIGVNDLGKLLFGMQTNKSSNLLVPEYRRMCIRTFFKAYRNPDVWYDEELMVNCVDGVARKVLFTMAIVAQRRICVARISLPPNLLAMTVATLPPALQAAFVAATGQQLPTPSPASEPADSST